MESDHSQFQGHKIIELPYHQLDSPAGLQRAT